MMQIASSYAKMMFWLFIIRMIDDLKTVFTEKMPPEFPFHVLVLILMFLLKWHDFSPKFEKISVILQVQLGFARCLSKFFEENVR